MVTFVSRMRWQVEVSSLGKTDTQKFCVEAESWQRALQAARSQRGEDGPMSGFSIELLEEGYRAVDPLARVRFVVKRAPDDMPITADPRASKDGKSKGVAPTAANAKAGAGVAPKGVPAAASSSSSSSSGPNGPNSAADPTTPNLPPSPSSSNPNANAGAAGKKAGAPRPGASASGGGLSHVVDEKKAQTMVFGGAADAAVAEKPVADRAPPPAIGSPIPGLPATKLMTSREQNPGDASPLTYREYAFVVPEGTNEETAAEVLRAQLRYVEAHIATAKTGKLVNLAVFDVEFVGKPPRPPLATLTWKDWKGDPVVGFPRRGGQSRPPRPPSKAPPGDAQARVEPVVVPQAPPVAQVAQVAPVAQPQAAQPAPQPIAEPPLPGNREITQPIPPEAKQQAVVAHAQAQAAAQQAQPPSFQPPSHPPPPHQPASFQPASFQPPSNHPPSHPPSHPPPAPAFPAPASGAPGPAAFAQQQQQLQQQQLQAQLQAQAQMPQAPAHAFAPQPPPEPTFTEAEPRKSPSQPPGGMVKTPSGRFVRGRISGDELITSLFESMHDLHFLRDALDGGQFCLALATEVLPARAAIIHFFDIDKREWVVACTRGKDTQRLLTMRSPENDGILREAARKRRALVVPNASEATSERYRQLGGGRSLIVAPIMQAGRALGALEIINPLDGMPFSEDEGNAMTYIAEQYAEYLGSRGIVLDRERIHSAAAAR